MMLIATPTTTMNVYQPLNLVPDDGTTLSDSRNCFYPAQAIFNTFVSRLNGLGALTSGWDGYYAAAPSQPSLDTARRIVSVAIGQHNLVPSALLPSAEGGVGIVFRAGTRYADIECFNSGEVLALTSDGSGIEPRVWEIDDDSADLTTALEVIGEHLGKFASAGPYSQRSAG